MRREAPAAARDAWRALHERSVVMALPAVGGLRVRGPDRLPFVNGQLSHRVADLAPGEAQPSLLLDHKGHVRAEVTVHRRDEDLYLAVEDGALDEVERHLREHVVFDEVEIAATTGVVSTVGVQGPATGDVLARVLGVRPPEPGRFVEAPFEDARVLLAARRRGAPGGADLHGLARQQDALLARLEEAGAEAAPREALEASRIAAGMPRAGLSVGVLPQEAGLESLINYRKGCYLGQEIMARLEARGRLKRHLSALALEGDPGGTGEGAGAVEIRAGERIVGRIAGAAEHPELGWIALAVLRDDVPADADLAVGATTGRRSDLPVAS